MELTKNEKPARVHKFGPEVDFTTFDPDTGIQATVMSNIVVVYDPGAQEHLYIPRLRLAEMAQFLTALARTLSDREDEIESTFAEAQKACDEIRKSNVK